MTPERLLCLLVALGACGLSATSAKRTFVQRIPNGANVPGVVAVGHSDNTGESSARNAFGRAFSNAGSTWTTALCQADSDGDGQTNGQELGDPCCVWELGKTPHFTTGLSHPSNAASTADSARWASVQCVPDAGTSSPWPTPSSAPSATPSADPTPTPTATPSTASTGASASPAQVIKPPLVVVVVGIGAGVVAGVVAVGGMW